MGFTDEEIETTNSRVPETIKEILPNLPWEKAEKALVL